MTYQEALRAIVFLYDCSIRRHEDRLFVDGYSTFQGFATARKVVESLNLEELSDHELFELRNWMKRNGFVW